MKDKIYKILDYNLVGTYEIKQKCADEILSLFAVSESLFVCKKCNFNMGWDVNYNCFNCGQPFENNDR